MSQTLFSAIRATLSSINEATVIADLDDSLCLVQAALGVIDGGPASIFFSGEDNDEVAWPNMIPALRRSHLTKYVLYEINGEFT
jgi:hypothetical protein